MPFPLIPLLVLHPGFRRRRRHHRHDRDEFIRDHDHRRDDGHRNY